MPSYVVPGWAGNVTVTMSSNTLQDNWWPVGNGNLISGTLTTTGTYYNVNVTPVVDVNWERLIRNFQRRQREFMAYVPTEGPEVRATPDEWERAEAVVARRAQEHATALVRARSALERFLSDEQRRTLEAERFIPVIGSEGRLYRVAANGQAGNVHWVDEAGIVQGTFCAHPEGFLPDPDAWLAQVLALQTDEDRFLRVANLHRGIRPPEHRAAMAEARVQVDRAIAENLQARLDRPVVAA